MNKFLNSKYGHLLKTILVTCSAYVISYGISLVLTPYITNHVGDEAYGYVQLAREVAEYAVILTCALNCYAGRYVTIAYHKGELDRANMYYSSTFIGDAILTVLIGAVSAICIVFLEKIIVIPEYLVGDVKWLFAFVIGKFAVTTLFTAFSIGAYTENRLDVVGLFKILSNLAQVAVLILCYAFFPAKVAYVGVALLASELVIAVSNVWVSHHYTPKLRVSRSKFSMAAVKHLITNGLWTSANSIGELLNNGLDLMFCNLMLTPLAMAQVAIARTVKMLFARMNDVIAQSVQPMLLKSYAKDDKTEFLGELDHSMKLSGLISNLSFAGFFALGMPYLKLWIPTQDTKVIYALTCITLMENVVTGLMKPMFYIYTLTVKRKVPCIITIVSGLLNSLSMYLLIKYTSLGVYSVVWTTTIIIAVKDAFINPFYMARVLGQPLFTFYPTLIRILLTCGAQTLLFYGLSRLYVPDGWITLILSAGVYSAAGLAVYYLIVLLPGKKGGRAVSLLNRLKKSN